MIGIALDIPALMVLRVRARSARDVVDRLDTARGRGGWAFFEVDPEGPQGFAGSIYVRPEAVRAVIDDLGCSQ